jgi:predicted DNA-binding transcriptional regulator AlpA
MFAMMHIDHITLAQFAALTPGPAHTVTVRRWTQQDPDCPKPVKLPNGHLSFNRSEVEAYLKRRKAQKGKRAA